jgi:hypothetical protein
VSVEVVPCGDEEVEGLFVVAAPFLDGVFDGVGGFAEGDEDAKLQRQMLHMIAQPIRFASFGDQFQVRNKTSDANSHLVRIDDSGKLASASHPRGGNSQEVFVLRHEGPPNGGRVFEQLHVVVRRAAILEGGDDVHAAEPQRPGRADRNKTRSLRCRCGTVQQAREAAVLGICVRGIKPREFVIELSLHLGGVVSVPCQCGIDFPERELRMIERQFLGTPAIGEMLANEMKSLETCPRDYRFAVRIELQVLIDRCRRAHEKNYAPIRQCATAAIAESCAGTQPFRLCWLEVVPTAALEFLHFGRPTAGHKTPESCFPPLGNRKCRNSR